VTRWPGIALLLCLATAPHAQAANEVPLAACPTIKAEIADLDRLVDGLEHSKAVGWVEKLRLKSSIDELIGRMKAYHRGGRHYTLAQLQEQYDVLMMRIASQLQGKDVALHGQLCNAWSPIWGRMTDRDWFMEKFS
jgi:hypothetical protein